jgi:uncharacterized membrane protein YhaH (DUF805 family)
MVTSPWLAMFYAWMPLGFLYLLFIVPPLFFLRARPLDDTTRAIWALAIMSVPILGALAFVIIQPGQRES